MNAMKLRSVSSELKVLMDEIQQGLKDGNMATDSMIEAGALLDGIAKGVAKNLEPIKTKLRQEALDRNKQHAGVVDLKSGVCSVRIPKAKITVRKNYDMKDLKVILGPAFSTVFHESLSYKPQTDFQESIGQCTQAEQVEIMTAIEMKDGSPQVFFNSGKLT